MNRRLIRDSAFLAIIPILTLMCVISFRGDYDMTRVYISMAGVVLQIPVMIFCKRDARTLFEPSVSALGKMNFKRVSCAYEPGRYRTDFKVLNVLLWLSMTAPFITVLAIRFPKVHTITVLNFFTYEGPNMGLILLSIACLLAGLLMLPLWVKFGQAMTIANESNDGVRYLYMGFAEVADQDSYFKTYQDMIKGDNYKYLK